MIDAHSCSYYCDRPECIRRQRDELRDKTPADGALPEWAIAMAFWEAFFGVDHYEEWWRVRVDLYSRAHEIAKAVERD